MPAYDLVPNYEQRTTKMRDTGGVDRGVFLQEVVFPTLKKVEVTRHELTKASSERRRAEKDAA
jgi:acyl-[acyl-carrier-protein] desaturase